MRFCTCSIQIKSNSDVYSWICEWMIDHGTGQDFHALLALPIRRVMTYEMDYNRGAYIEFPDKGLFGTKIPPPPLRKVQKKIRYEPSLGTTQYFWWKGRLFLWHRQRSYHGISSGAPPVALIEARIYCLSRTTKSIKGVIEEALVGHFAKTGSKTCVRRPQSKMNRKMGMPWGHGSWRMSRPLDTVILGEDQKERIIVDIQEYLTPQTQRWYAERGIPYRRGYLFYVKPGTGKSSLSFALAGYFALDIYCLSLAEPSISEEDLVTLFEALPEKCLVLLEDIDSAGLRVRKSKSQTQYDSDDNDASNQSSHISLSGLLNVIDGITSQEGRILIMTTNHIETLDNALLRPGRTDMRVHFELATKKQAGELFMRTFFEKAVEGEDEGQSAEKLRQMALVFAEQIPENTLSPAEIQGFLMNWKKRPAEAVENVKDWVVKEVENQNSV